jgi:uncharacterized lipoprotein
MKKLFALTVIAYLVGACAVRPVPRQIVNSLAIEKAFDSTWSAVIETFAELNLPIMNVEKASGLITTDWISFKSQNDETGYCACGTAHFPLSEVDRRGKINVFIIVTNNSVEMKVNAVFEKISQYKEIVENTPCVSTGKLEAEIRKRVSEKIK